MQSQDSPVVLKHNFTQLKAVGETDSLNVIGMSYHTFKYKIASINTNVVLRFEGSDDSTDWFNLDDNRIDITETANGTYKKHKPNFRCDYVRGYLVSESGGSDVTVDIVYIGGKE